VPDEEDTGLAAGPLETLKPQIRLNICKISVDITENTVLPALQRTTG